MASGAPPGPTSSIATAPPSWRTRLIDRSSSAGDSVIARSVNSTDQVELTQRILRRIRTSAPETPRPAPTARR